MQDFLEPHIYFLSSTNLQMTIWYNFPINNAYFTDPDSKLPVFFIKYFYSFVIWGYMQGQSSSSSSSESGSMVEMNPLCYFCSMCL